MPKTTEIPSIDIPDSLRMRFAGLWGKEGSIRISRTGSHTLKETEPGEEPRIVPYYKLFISLTNEPYIQAHQDLLDIRSERSTIWTISNRKAERFLAEITPDAIVRKKQMELGLAFQHAKKARPKGVEHIDARLTQETWFEAEMRRLRTAEELDELPDVLTDAYFPFLDGLFHAGLTPEPYGNSYRSRLNLRNVGFLMLLKDRFGGSIAGINETEESIVDEKEGQAKENSDLSDTDEWASIKSHTWYIYGKEMDKMFEELYPEYRRGIQEGFPRDPKREEFYTKILGVGFEKPPSEDRDVELSVEEQLRIQLAETIAENIRLKRENKRFHEQMGTMPAELNTLRRDISRLSRELRGLRGVNRTLVYEVSSVREQLRYTVSKSRAEIADLLNQLREKNTKQMNTEENEEANSAGKGEETRRVIVLPSVGKEGIEILNNWGISEVDKVLSQTSTVSLDEINLPQSVEQVILGLLYATGLSNATHAHALTPDEIRRGLLIIRNNMEKNSAKIQNLEDIRQFLIRNGIGKTR
jgi:hypothetical protein